MFHRSPAVGVLPLLIALSGCGAEDASESPDPVDEPEQHPSFALGLSTDRLPVLQGTSEVLTVTVQRKGGFRGKVELEVTGLPEGAQVVPVSIPDTETEVVLAVKADADAPHSLPTTVTVAGTASGTKVSRQLAVTITGAPGTVDSSFEGGNVLVPVGDADAYAYAMAQDSEGRLVIAGNCHDHRGDFGLLRLTRDGRPDAEFGDGGVVTTEIGSGSDVARAVAIDAQGRIVVAGTTDNGSHGIDFAVARYLTDGELDTSFGDGGKVVTTLGEDSDTAYALLLQPDGKLVVGGDSNRGSAQSGMDFALVRYFDDGQLDREFGDEGVVIQSIASFAGRDSVYALALQDTSGEPKIVAVGGEGDFSLARFTADGFLDTTFGEQGLLSGLFGSTIGAARAVAVDAAGELFVAGHAGHDFALVKLTGSGSLDASFGTEGRVVTPVSESNWDEAQGLALEADGKVVVGGWAYEDDSSAGNTALVRYTDDGLLDEAFGDGGIVITPVAAAKRADQASALLLQPDDRVPSVRIVVAGFANSSFAEFAVTRFWR